MAGAVAVALGRYRQALGIEGGPAPPRRDSGEGASEPADTVMQQLQVLCGCHPCRALWSGGTVWACSTLG